MASFPSFLARASLRLTALALILGCEDSLLVGPQQRSPFELLARFELTQPVRGEIWIEATTVGATDDAPEAHAYAWRSYVHEPDSLITIGDVSVAGEVLPWTTGIGYFDIIPSLASGGNVGISVEGNSTFGIPAFVDTLYVPPAIRMISPVAPGGPAISVSNPLTVQWNADALNDSVLIFVLYDSYLSHLVDSTLDGDDRIWSTWVADCGATIIPSSAFTGMSVGGECRIGVIRGNSRVGGPEAAPFGLISYSIADGLFRLAE